jgi:hypothetical protein
VDCVADEPDEVSDLIAFSADEAAPRANSMVKLRQLPRHAAHTFRLTMSKRRAIAKSPIKSGFFISGNDRRPRQLMPLRQNFPPSTAGLARIAPGLGAC